MSDGIDMVSALTDMTLEVLELYKKTFREAHKLVPGGLSVEVGTRQGGSALAFLQLLAEMYPVTEGKIPPCLFTVDPYGFKPYNSGIPERELEPIYGDNEYLVMKAALKGFAYHAHFKLESLDFFYRMHGCPYWHPGEVAYTTKNQGGEFALGERLRMGNLAFCLLDGDHDWRTIASELGHLWGGKNALTGALTKPWMNPKGLVCVDNIDCDPKTRPYIEEHYIAEFGPTWAIVGGAR